MMSKLRGALGRQSGTAAQTRGAAAQAVACSSAPQARPLQLERVQAVVGAGIVVQLLAFAERVHSRAPNLRQCAQPPLGCSVVRCPGALTCCPSASIGAPSSPSPSSSSPLLSISSSSLLSSSASCSKKTASALSARPCGARHRRCRTTRDSRHKQRAGAPPQAAAPSAASSGCGPSRVRRRVSTAAADTPDGSAR